MGHAQFAQSNTATVAQLADFDEIIDVRSPAEFAEDHVPGAVNHPVLNNDERHRIGKLYKHNRFEARRIGASLIASNVSRHLQTFSYPASWRPLVYCWRGGKRSASLASVLREIGWPAQQLEGGYKAYRRMVVAELESLPARFRYIVICGATGSGKSRLLAAIREAKAQTLDLEALARHRGSVLGNLPGEAQPSQKMFESAIWSALRGLRAELPVFVEAESKKIGTLRIPEALMRCLWQSECVQVDASLDARLEILQSDYRYFFEAPALLKSRLDALAPVHGNETIGRWKEMAEPARWRELVTELLQQHYDPAYRKSTLENFCRHAAGERFELSSPAPISLQKLAVELITRSHARPSR
jgi:tRNA 2-selenouridine synthase